MKKKWIEEARRLLTSPHVGLSATVPDGFSQPWLFVVKALGYAYFDWETALEFFERAFDGQCPDGGIPLHLQGFTQPEGMVLQERPFFAPVLWRLAETAPDRKSRKSALARFLPKIIAHQMFWYAHRNFGQEGLLGIIHPQESPQPTAIAWDKWYRPRPEASVIGEYAAQKETAYMPLQGNTDSSPPPKFLVQDPYLNALAVLSNMLLLRMGNSIGIDLQEILELHELTVFSMNDKLWNEEYGIFSPYDLEAEELILSGALGCWMPWIGAVPDQNRAEAMRFAFEVNFHHPDFCLCASNSIFASATFSGTPHRGAVHLWDNWLLFQGLQLYDFSDLARDLKRDLIALCQQYGFQLQYPVERDPGRSIPYLPETAAPAAAIFLALLQGKSFLNALS